MYSVLNMTQIDDTSFLGHAAETYAYQKLSEYCQASKGIYVERGKGLNEEVDFYLPQDNLLLECKYTARPRLGDLKYLRSRSEALDAVSIALSRQQSIGDGVRVVPLMLL